jgi:hypothetical protein
MRRAPTTNRVTSTPTDSAEEVFRINSAGCTTGYSTLALPRPPECLSGSRREAPLLSVRAGVIVFLLSPEIAVHDEPPEMLW